MNLRTATGFDWDDGNRLKCQKHGVSLAEVELVFLGEPFVAPDDRHSRAEQRFIASGVDLPRPVFVAFTIRYRNGATLVRPISARYMHRDEVEKYA